MLMDAQVKFGLKLAGAYNKSQQKPTKATKGQ